MTSGVVFSTCGVMLVLKKVVVFGILWISAFWIRDAHPVVYLKQKVLLLNPYRIGYCRKMNTVGTEEHLAISESIEGTQH